MLEASSLTCQQQQQQHQQHPHLHIPLVGRLQFPHVSLSAALRPPNQRQPVLQPLSRTMAEFSEAAVADSPTPAADSSPAPAASTTGRWKRTGESDSLDEACEAVKLGFVLRKAVKLVRVVEVEETDAHFLTRDVTERYPWDGEEVVHKRRDKRGGVHRGRVARTAQGPKVTIQWDEPYAGSQWDLYEVEGDRMVQTTEMRMAADGRLIKYRTVYRRLS